MSSWAFNLKPGDAVTVSGPYGEFFARETNKEMCFIGGGAGMAPMRSHIFDQLLRLIPSAGSRSGTARAACARPSTSTSSSGWRGEHPNFEWHLALSEPLPEDQWTGPVGFIHNVLRDRYLDDASGARGRRVLHVRPGCHEQRGDRHADRTWAWNARTSCSTISVEEGST